MKEVKIGILGFGTVGAGVVEGILKNGELMAQRSGILPIIGKIADLDIESDRGVEVDASLLTTDALSVINDSDIDVIVELVGGVTVAKEFVLRALRNGKPVVTANKALLAEAGRELFEASVKSGAGLYFEASVAGGIPVLRALRDGLVGNRIQCMYGILNGTCNYILTRMEREGLPFDEILADAQKLGYAETPPDLDIDGIDTAHKTVILASMAYGAPVPMSVVASTGIRGLSGEEIANADALGYRIKLLSIIKEGAGKIELSVEPALVPKTHMIALVNDSFNAVFVKGDIVGDTMYYGRGAGRLPTASAVIGDIMEAAVDRLHGVGSPVGITMMLQRDTLEYCAAEEIEKRCYIRLPQGDLAAAQDVLATEGIGIASVEESISVILTQSAREAAFVSAAAELGDAVRLRIEDVP